MDSTLREALARDGATFGELSGRPEHFGDPPEELRLALDRCALADRSDSGRVVATGPDLLGLLHRLSTGDVASLEPGDGRPTVLTTAKGRIIQRLFVQHLGPEGVLLIAGSGRAPAVRAHLEKFVFSEDLGLSEIGESWSHLVVAGPLARAAVANAGLDVPDEYATSRAELDGDTVFVLGHDGLSKSGVSMVVP